MKMPPSALPRCPRPLLRGVQEVPLALVVDQCPRGGVGEHREILGSSQGELVEFDSTVVSISWHLFFSNRLSFTSNHVCFLPIIGLWEQLNTLTPAIDTVTRIVNACGET